MKAAISARITPVWVVLSAITVLSWWLGHTAHAHGHFHASVLITVAVLAIGVIKARLILSYFMEVRTAPTWLRALTDAWLIALWGAILAIYLY
jgi:hypothetical protein